MKYDWGRKYEQQSPISIKIIIKQKYMKLTPLKLSNVKIWGKKKRLRPAPKAA